MKIKAGLINARSLAYGLSDSLESVPTISYFIGYCLISYRVILPCAIAKGFTMQDKMKIEIHWREDDSYSVYTTENPDQDFNSEITNAIIGMNILSIKLFDNDKVYRFKKFNL